MLERRTNQGMLRLIQPKDRGCVSSGEKPSVKEKVENGPVAANCSGHEEHEGKTQHEKTDGANYVPSHTGVTKPGPVNVSAPLALETPSPLASHGLGKLTYNPITHAPSRCEFIFTGSTQSWVSNLSTFFGTDQNMLVKICNTAQRENIVSCLFRFQVFSILELCLLWLIEKKKRFWWKIFLDFLKWGTNRIVLVSVQNQRYQKFWAISSPDFHALKKKSKQYSFIEFTWISQTYSIYTHLLR